MYVLLFRVYLATLVFLSLDTSFHLILYNYKSKWSAREGRWQLSEAHREIEHIVLILKEQQCLYIANSATT